MASTPSSYSEGEIHSSDSDKAKSPRSRNGYNVDPQTRLSAPTPRSPTFRSARSRSRSRSPYRAPRGEKRRRDEEAARDRGRYDSRRFDVRYEDDRYHRRKASDLDTGYARRSHLSYDDEHDRRYRSKRQRTRSQSLSRSPPRHLRRHDPTIPSRDNHTSDGGDQRRGSDGVCRLHAEQPVSERSQLPGLIQSSKTLAETGTNQESRNLSATGSRGSLSKRENSAKEGEDMNHELAPVLDEATQIEERRKRREALKNKYRGQATPLRIQALHLDGELVSGASTSRESPAAPGSPNGGSPRTPKDTSDPQSPADMSFDKDDIANQNTDPSAEGDDEPFAADYDPRFDMQEERSRHDQSLFNEGYSHTILEPQTEQHSTRQSTTLPKTPKDTFDMFAEEDEDLDMFAETSKAAKEPEAEIKVPQALDVNMMDNWDDPEGYYNAILGELIQGRYHVQQNLGRGMFASVVRARDNKTHRDVAIKIIRNNETMFKAGKKEIDILKDLAANDPEDKKHVIRLDRSLEHKGHLCMVFPHYSSNLRELLKKYGRDVGLNLKAIRVYAQQLLLALSLMKKCQYLHADLKPDNILVGPKPDVTTKENVNILKLCDLGTASSITEATTAPYLVSRFYRAPELILGIPYDYGIDMWSAGCTLFELYTGKILFTGRNNNAMLRSIMECRGKFPHKQLRKGTETFKYFDDLLNFYSMDEDKATGRMVTKSIDIKAKPVRDLRSRVLPKGKRLDESERKEVELFLDLLERCLDLRVEKRITPGEALRHGFITRTK